MKTQNVVKSNSQDVQKEMISRNYDKITSGKVKVSSTFVPGNLNELLMCFDIANNLPEINAIQNAMRKKSGEMIMEAERSGHSEDVCTYVKADIGMMAKGNIAPNGKPFPDPDVLLLSYTGCFTFLKWFELLREQYKCPTVMLHVPYAADGAPTKNMRDYIVKQLKEEVIPTLEKISGIKFDIDRLRGYLRKSAIAEDNLVWMLEQAKRKPSPIDCYFGGVYYMGPIFTAFRGTDECIEYYNLLREEIQDRIDKGLCAQTPEGTCRGEYRLVVEVPPTGPLSGTFGRCSTKPAPSSSQLLHQGRRGLRLRRFPPRPRQPDGDPGRLLPGCLHQPEPPHPCRHAGQKHQEYEADGLLINSIRAATASPPGSWS